MLDEKTHTVTLHHEHGQYTPYNGCPSRRRNGHYARCTCGWLSDCYEQIADTQRALDVHLRRFNRASFEALLVRSSIGGALADIKERGLEKHLEDLEAEMRPHRRAKKKLSSPEATFMRGFGCALASIWRVQHDGQLVQMLLKENGFALESFRDVGLLDGDYAAICQAVKR
jgi:hypothetical protein